MSIALYFNPFTRATRPRWMLEELGVDYAIRPVDLRAGEHKAADYVANVHPHGSVPALEVDGVVMIESGAMIAWLADRFADRGLAPALDAPQRAPYLQWLFYAYATLEPALIEVLGHRKADATASDEVKAKAEDRYRTALAFVERGIGAGPWLLGDRFSAADVAIGSVVTWGLSSTPVEGLDGLKAYAERVKSRPAFHKARKP
jgi:glutathione S-transferase